MGAAQRYRAHTSEAVLSGSRTSSTTWLSCTAASVILYDRWYKRPIRNSIDRPAAYSWRDGGPARRLGPCLPRGRSAWPRRRRRGRPWPPFPSPGDRRLVFVPRSGRYGAGGKTWRHISQSARVPPDRRLAPHHHECQQGEPGLTIQPHLQESSKLGRSPAGKTGPGPPGGPSVAP